MSFYPTSNTGCLNWVKRPHGDSLGDAVQLGVTASLLYLGTSRSQCMRKQF